MQTIDEQYEERHRTQIDATLLLITRNINKLQAELTNLLRTSTDKKYFDQVSKRIFKGFSNRLTLTISHSMAEAWNLANLKNDALCREYFAGIKVKVSSEYFRPNLEAMKTFIKRTEDGMELSGRVWNLTNQVQAQLEEYMGTGIMHGRSSADISRDIRLLLREPEKLFRRVRSEKGILKLGKNAQRYHPGQGIYRSSYKNALRLTATETNMSYRMSDYHRRQQLDFILGIRIRLSESHPRPDICDHMAGDYPSDFIFRGWHPWCLCHSISLLMSGSEYKRMQKSGKPPGRKVIAIPDKTESYIRINANTLKRLKSVPYFITDNSLYYSYLFM